VQGLSALGRLPYLEAGQSDDPDRIADLFAQIARLGRPVANLYRILANKPAALSAFLGMSRYVRDESGLSPRLRELAILATAHAIEQPYEIAHHRPIAIELGIRAEMVDALGDPVITLDDPLEQAVVDYAREVAATRKVSDATFECLRRLMNTSTIVDLVVIVAWYHLCAAILGPLQVGIEPELQRPNR